MTLDEIFADEKKLRKLYATSVLLTDMLGNDIRVNNTLKCPFHDDSRPSAKLYVNDDGSQSIYCFTEHKQYTSYDYVVSILCEDPKLFLLSNYGEENINFEIMKIDFSSCELNSCNYYIAKFDELITNSNDKLPDVTDFLNSIYTHGIEVKI